MDDFYGLRCILREKFYSLIKNSDLEEKFIEFIETALFESKKFDIKPLEVILDLTLAVIDPAGNKLNHGNSGAAVNVISPTNKPLFHTMNEPTISSKPKGGQIELDDEYSEGPSIDKANSTTRQTQQVPFSVSHDADDEGLDETYIFPCHVSFSDCHPELLSVYHSDHMKSTKAAQLIKFPKLCEFAVRFMLKSLNTQLGILEAHLDRSRPIMDPAIILELKDSTDGQTTNNNVTLNYEQYSESEKVSSSSFDSYLESMVVILRRLNKVCITEKKNCRILSKTNLLTNLLQNISTFIAKMPDMQHVYLEPMLDFALTLADHKLTGQDLKIIFHIIRDERTDLNIVLTYIQQLLDHHYKIMRNIKPIKSLSFPVATKTAEEIESNTHISNTWHSRLRGRLTEFKRKQSRLSSESRTTLVTSNSSTSEQSNLRENQDTKTNSAVSTSSSDFNEGRLRSSNARINPCWLECSLIAPLSSVTPLIQNGAIKFSTSMWISVCGDLLVIDRPNSQRSPNTKNPDRSTAPWSTIGGHWLRLTSRRRLSSRFSNKQSSSLKQPRKRRLSVKLKRRQALDREDEEQDELNSRKKKSEMDLDIDSFARSAFGLRSFSSNQVGLMSSGIKKVSKTNKGRLSDLTSRKEHLNALSKTHENKSTTGGKKIKNNSQELLMHIVSFAVDTLTIEFWLNVKNMSFCVRACRVAREGQTLILDQSTFPSHIQSNSKWAHLMLVLEESYKSETTIELNLIVTIDAVHTKRLKLKYAAHKSPISNFACLLGCARSTFGYVWKLSHVTMYRDLPPIDIPIYLLGKGPDCWSFTNFQQQTTLPLADATQRNIEVLMNAHILELYDGIDEAKALNWLTENTIMAFSAQKPEQFLDYSPVVTNSTMMSSLPADFEFKNSAERFIQARILNFSRNLKFDSSSGFGTALVETGGIESVLVCFADIIRRVHNSPSVHSLAFTLLFKMSQSNLYHLEKFLDELNGLKLVEFILIKPECLVSQDILDYYMDFCLVKQGKHSVIKSSKLIYHLLSCWRAWHKDISIAKSFYMRLISLLKPVDYMKSPISEERLVERCYVNHNLRLMIDAGGIDILMGILRECLVSLDDVTPLINHELVEMIVNLISLLIKHPPGLDTMLDIMEFLLFLHPDPKAYVESSDKVSFLSDISIDGSSEFKTSSNQTPTPMSGGSSLFVSSNDIFDQSNDQQSGAGVYSDEELGPDIDQNMGSSVKDKLNSIHVSHSPPDENSSNVYEHSTRQNTKSGTRSRSGSARRDLDREDNWQKRTSLNRIDDDDEEPDKLDRSDKLDRVQNCSYRNYAVAHIADMLASIVKLTLTDPMRILSEALEKPIIDIRKLIVLANNSSALVREKVLRLFLYCIRACYNLNLRTVLSRYEHERKGSKFKTCIPIHLMANQLLKYPTTMKMIKYCYGIIVGIDDFERVESVCLVFDVETANNNLHINVLILLMHLMTQLQNPNEIYSTLRFVHSFIRQLIDIGEEDLISVLLKNCAIDSLMRLYLFHVEYITSRPMASINSDAGVEERDEDPERDAYEDMCHELDQTLVSIICFFKQNPNVGESQRSVEDLLQNFDVINNYIPVEYQWILRDRKVQILNTALAYCWNNEKYSKRRNYSVRVGYYFRSLLRSGDMSKHSNFLSDPKLLDEAIKITQDVVNDKHEQRKVHLEDMKRNKVTNYHVRQQWLSLIIGQTHERAMWYLEDYHPKSWELNPVEGPSRIRRRLRPCRLTLDTRFVRSRAPESSKMEQSKPKLSRQSECTTDDWFNHYSPHPLCSLVINGEQSTDSNELRTRMFTTDKIHFNCDCSIIRPNEVCEGEISIASWCIHFIGGRNTTYTYSPREAGLGALSIDRQIGQVNQRSEDRFGSTRELGAMTDIADDSSNDGQTAHGSPTNNGGLPRLDITRARNVTNTLPTSRPNSTIVEDLWFDEIVEIWDRRYQLQEVGLEIFLTNNMTYLMSFRSYRDREDFKQCLMQEQHKMINLQRVNLNTNLNRLTQLWREGRLTNFDYLTCLNKLAGRSFNDLMQYPVFPFVLSNYTSSTLDLTKAENFRKLKRPMAVQNEEKEAVFVNNYNHSKSSNLSIGLSGVTEPYHYGNHYSNSATVLHFLVRLPPFTQILIQYQDNNFDQPDRTFHSMANTWQLITKDSNTDFKELIPEFFFLPEMFINYENFNLGRKQNNELVDDVCLPKWCPDSDARLFTLIHRQALESSYVSENLHHWVDLIFGFKQTGRAAVEALNVFHPATYYGMIDLSRSNSPSGSLTPIGPLNANPLAQSSSFGSDYLMSTNDPTSSLSSRAAHMSSFKSVLLSHSLRQQSDIERLALETMIKTYGQMPRQLFAYPVRQRAYCTYAPIVTRVFTSPGSLTSLEQMNIGFRRFEPLRNVKGIRWGSYVGSPDENDIAAIRHRRIQSDDESDRNRPKRRFYHLRERKKAKFTLCLLPNGEVAILRDDTSLLLDYRADRKSSGSYQLSLPTARYSRRAGLSSVARMNLFSNMIISRQQFSFFEPMQLYGSSQFDTTSSTSSLAPLSGSKSRFSPDSLSLVSWSYLDGTVRIRHPALNSQKPSVPLVQADSNIDAMTACASVPELNLLLIGYKSGAICAHIVSIMNETIPIEQYPATSLAQSTLNLAALDPLSQTFNSSLTSLTSIASGSVTPEPSATPKRSKVLYSQRSINRTTRWLYCHSERVACMQINVSFGIVVTGSDDGTSVIWDLNNLTYVRTIDYKLSSANGSGLSQKDVDEGGRNSNEEAPKVRRFSFSNLLNQSKSDYLCNCDSFSPNSTFKNKDGRLDTYQSSKPNCVCGYGVSLICISDTLGDIVTVKDFTCRLAIAADKSDNVDNSGDERISGERTKVDSEASLSSDKSAFSTTSSRQDDQLSKSSVIYVHTINGSLVGFVNCDTQVTAVCYSQAPEGISVNVIVAGLANGLIRLYSSWDLSRVKEFHVSGLSLPISSLLYSRDNQLLYIAYEDGQLVVLRNKKKKQNVSLPTQWFL